MYYLVINFLVKVAKNLEVCILLYERICRSLRTSEKEKQKNLSFS